MSAYELTAEDLAITDHVASHEGSIEDIERWIGIHRKARESARSSKRKLEAELAAVDRAIMMRQAAIYRLGQRLEVLVDAENEGPAVRAPGKAEQ